MDDRHLRHQPHRHEQQLRYHFRHFPAGGDTRFGFICDTIVLWAIVVPLGFLAAFVWKLPIWVTYIFINMDEWVKIPAVFQHYFKYQWVKNLTIQEE